MRKRRSLSSFVRSFGPERPVPPVPSGPSFSAEEWATVPGVERIRRCRAMAQEALAAGASDKRNMQHHYVALATQWSEIADELQAQIGPHESYRKREARASDHETGKWDYLDGLDEFAHYAIIAGYYARLRPGGSVLDLGCGAGLMQRTLLPYNYSHYLGVDISPEAIERASRASEACGPRADTTFKVGDLAWPVESDGARFDVIIFNESLYYLENPVLLLSRLRMQTLAPQGIFIVSMWHSQHTRCLWSMLAHNGWEPADVTIVRNKAGTTWKICTFPPSRNSG